LQNRFLLFFSVTFGPAPIWPTTPSHICPDSPVPLPPKVEESPIIAVRSLPKCVKTERPNALQGKDSHPKDRRDESILLKAGD